MDYTSASGESARELEDLRKSGTLSEDVTLERAGSARSPVMVRPAASDALDGWMPAVERTIDVASGVVAFSGPDMVETAEIAAQAAAWLGDRGRTIVLVDASVERPVLGKPLPEDGDEGLVDAVLFGVSPQAVVRRTLTPGVRVVTTGSHPLSVDGVFDGGGLPVLLRRLADEALVLLLVPPAYLSSVSGTLEAAVCIASGVADIESAAKAVDGVRTLGIHVRGRSEGAPEARKAGEPSESSAIVLPTHEMTRVTAERRSAAVVLGAAEPARTRPDRLPSALAVAVILVIATVIWWTMDGRQRFQPRIGAPAVTGQERVTEAADSEPGGDGAAEPVEIAPAEDVEGEGTTTENGAAYAEAPPPNEERPGEAAAITGPGGTEGAAAITGPGGPYRIMVSSHHREASAEVEAAELGRKGVAAEVAAAEIEGRGTWFRVLVSGGYPTLVRARAVLDTIRSFGYEGAWIERAPQVE